VFLKRSACVVSVLALLAGCASTKPPETIGTTETTDKLSSLSFLPEKGRTMAPFPHVVFCMNSPLQCKDGGGKNIVAMTGRTQTVLDSVNTAVNNAIIPRESPGEPWKIDPPSGDCNDYAVSKRSSLIEAGLPSRAVRLAVAMTPQGIGHTVVVVRTTNGDVVLDNRTFAIKRWDKTDLSWLKVQSSTNPKNWDRL